MTLHRYIDRDSQMTPIDFQVTSTANAEQTYFVIRGVKAQRVDAESTVEGASVCGGTSQFAPLAETYRGKPRSAI
ncbi:hypothetical protein DPMN_094387 [Dreissena polymorpha]|uniref:Uncharacterized protein n=1 Tax=Dreissena polymorpha TaxID=45954 RepID=A0A9D4L4P0_DREPO|nr:hypothetical protein DPMN_094387 [Dreissena polymorpha]